VRAEVARGYVSARLCSPRYLLPAAGLPLLSAHALARFGLPALLAVGAHHVILAHRYRRRWTRPGALFTSRRRSAGKDAIF
jgi:hypothetical protein